MEEVTLLTEITLYANQTLDEVTGGLLVTDTSYRRPTYSGYAKLEADGSLEFLGTTHDKRFMLHTIETAAKRDPVDSGMEPVPCGSCGGQTLKHEVNLDGLCASCADDTEHLDWDDNDLDDASDAEDL